MNEEEINTEAIKRNIKNLNIPSNQLDSDSGPSMLEKVFMLLQLAIIR
jgi:hypothetical protein